MEMETQGAEEGLELEGKAIANAREDKAFHPAMLPCPAGELEVWYLWCQSMFFR